MRPPDEKWTASLAALALAAVILSSSAEGKLRKWRRDRRERKASYAS